MSSAAAAFSLLERLDALRRPQRLTSFLAAASSWNPNLGVTEQPLLQALDAARQVGSEDLRATGLSGVRLADAMRDARRAAVAVAWEEKRSQTLTPSPSPRGRGEQE
jgi:hypothetical protein